MKKNNFWQLLKQYKAPEGSFILFKNSHTKNYYKNMQEKARSYANQQ